MTMVPIQSVIITSSANITFSNIPQIYKHLQIRILGRGLATFVDGLSQYINFNGDFGSNYGWHSMYGFGTGTSSTAPASFPSAVISSPQIFTDASSLADSFGASITDIYNYSSSSTYKTIKVFGGFDRTTNGRVSLNSGYWTSNAAITSITIQSDSGIAVGTRADLYGIVG